MDTPSITREIEIVVDQWGCVARQSPSLEGVAYRVRLSGCIPTPAAMSYLVRIGQQATAMTIVGHGHDAAWLAESLPLYLKRAADADRACLVEDVPLPF